MVKHVRIFRLALNEANLYLGPSGEMVYVTEGPGFRIHDGVQVGGYALLTGANNLAELTNKATARTSLELGPTAAIAQATLGFGNSVLVNATDTGRSLVAINNVPVADQTVATFTGTTGTIRDVGLLVADVLTKSGNLAGLVDTATSRTNLGLGTAAVKAATDNTQIYVASVSSAAINCLAFFDDNIGTLETSGITYTDVLTKPGNLAGLGSASAARTNLGLGNVATKTASDVSLTIVAMTYSVGINEVPFQRDANGTLATSGILYTDILTKSGNLAGIASPSAARTALGLGTVATFGITNVGATFAVGMISTGVVNKIPVFFDTNGSIINSGIDYTNLPLISNQGSDYTAVTFRGNLGLGTAAVRDASRASNPLAAFIGSAVANNLVAMDGTDGSLKDSGYPAPAFFRGTEVTLTSPYSEGHSLGAVPTDRAVSVTWHMRCTSTDQGYAIGDVINITPGYGSRNDNGQVWVNDTAVGWAYGTNGIIVTPKAGGNGAGVNNAKWVSWVEIKFG